MDVQHRRQANFYEHDKNIFHFGLTNSIRIWTYYTLKQNWSIVASPIAYFENKSIINAPGVRPISKELRSMIGIGKNLFFQKLVNQSRLIYEMDLLNFNYPETLIKHRYRLLNNFILPIKAIDLTHSLNYTFYNEIFFKTQNGMSSFDQNHLYSGIQFKWIQSNFNVGYQYTYQKLIKDYINKNQILLSLNFTW